VTTEPGMMVQGPRQTQGSSARAHDFPAPCRDLRSRLDPTCRDRSPAARGVSKSGLRRFLQVILLN
jgi:hypothetical protein